ncbi:MAG TPA: hypothetical protein VGI30_10650 [Caulobacteraceae bacterium]|jgi:hypothetical protein
MSETGLFLVKVDAVAGEACQYPAGQAMRLLVICKADSADEATAAALTPLTLAGWTQARMLSAGPLEPDPAALAGTAGDATRHALANGYAIIAYP